MTLEEVAQDGNEGAVKMLTAFLDKYGEGKQYKCAATAAASVLLIHAFRLGLPSQEKGVEILGAVLSDVAHNIHETSGHQVEFQVVAQVREAGPVRPAEDKEREPIK